MMKPFLLGNHSLMEGWEGHGLFWLAGQPEHKAGGKLSYDPEEGVFLETAHSVEGGQSRWMWDSHAQVAIVGEIDSVRVSLLNWFWLRKSTGQYRYFANRAIIGVATDRLESLKIRAIVFAFDGLEQWTGIQPLSRPEAEEREPSMTTSITFTEPESIRVRAPDESLNLDVGARRWSEIDYANRAAHIGYRCEARATFDEPIDWHKSAKKHDELSTMFMALMGHPHKLTYYGVEASTDAPASAPDEDRWRRCAVFGTRSDIGGKKRDWFDEPMIKFASLGRDGFEQFVQKWLALAKQIRTVHNVFFGELRSPSPRMETKLFHTSQCLEALHRSIFGDEKYVEKAVLKRIKNELVRHIPADAPAGLVDRIKRSIDFANSHDFIERARALLNDLEPETRALITDNAELWISHVVGTRNVLTHLDSTSSRPTFPQARWLEAYASMTRLMNIQLLKMSGISEESIRNHHAIFKSRMMFEAYEFGDEQQIAADANVQIVDE